MVRTVLKETERRKDSLLFVHVVVKTLRPGHTRRQVAATGLCDKLLHVYYLQNNSLRHDACSEHIRATDRGDEISESSVVASCVHFRQQVAATKYK